MKGTDALAQTNQRFVRRWLLLALLTLLLVVWAVGLASGQSVSLRQGAVIAADEIAHRGGLTLDMVADLDGFADADAGVLGALVVLADAKAPAQITLPEVREAMRRAGVNLGMVTLRGFSVCELRIAGEPAAFAAVPRTPVREEPLAMTLATSPSAAAMPAAPLDIADAATLRDLIESRLRGALDLPAEQVVCIFDGRDDATLNQSTLGATFAIEPVGDVRLGRMNLRVARTAGFGEPVRYAMGVRIGWKTSIVTATRDIVPHERLNENNLALTEVTIDRDLDGELFDLEAARGAVAASTIRAGTAVRTRDLGQPVLVKRGQMVTVLVRRGGFEMTTTGYAEHDAALHEPVTLRSDARRTRDTKTFRAFVTGPARVSVSPETPSATRETARLAQGH